MGKNTMRSVLVCVAAVLAGSGCMVHLSPGPVELKRSTQPPIFRVGKITEELTGSWAEEARKNDWGGKNVLSALLRQSDAASLFSSDPSNLAVDVHLVSSHEDDAPRLAFLALMSVCTLGIMPLHYRSEWTSDITVTMRMCDGSVADEQAFQAKGVYDIWAMPLTMFTLGAAALRGPLDGAEVRRRMTTKGMADVVAMAERDYGRLAKVKAKNAVMLASQPVLPPPTPGPALGTLPAPISRRYAVIVGSASTSSGARWASTISATRPATPRPSPPTCAATRAAASTT